jgi:hypothetical protein
MEMRQGVGFRVLAALLLLGFVAFLTAGAYGAGFAAGAGTPATNVSPWVYGGAFGAGHVVGLIVTIIILVIAIRVIGLIFFGRGHRAWAHHGYWAQGDPNSPTPGDWQGMHGGWHRGEWRDAAQARFDEFHSRAHGTEPPASGNTPSGAAGNPQPR